MSAQVRKGASGGSVRTPGEHLRAEMQRLGFDQGTLAEALGVSRQSVNNIVTDRLPISRAMAGKLARVTGRSSDYWLQDAFTAKGGNLHSLARAPGILVRRQILRAVEDGIIGIDPFDPARVRVASIELTLDRVAAARGGGRRARLKRGEITLLWTREKLDLPLDYVGRLGANEKTSASALIPIQQLQIEPGFKGHVQFSLFNAGHADVMLESGEPIVCVEIIALSAAA